MDPRRFPRFETDQEVQITCLDKSQAPATAKLRNFSFFGCGIVLKEALPAGALVKVEWSETALLGELIYCRPEGGEFVAGLEVEEVVYKPEVAAIRANMEADISAVRVSVPGATDRPRVPQDGR